MAPVPTLGSQLVSRQTCLLPPLYCTPGRAAWSGSAGAAARAQGRGGRAGGDPAREGCVCHPPGPGAAVWAGGEDAEVDRWEGCDC